MCKGKCQNLCAAPRCATKPVHHDIHNLRELLHESETRNPGMTLAPHAPAIRAVLDEVEASRNKAAGHSEAKEVVLVRMKAPPDDGPISGAAIRERMMSLCGCQGRYDCDCVALRNQVTRELWSEHNVR